jgi:small redox-active disulfide protein 2
MITVKVLGPGCANCKAVEAAAREAVASLSLQTDIVKVQNREDIVQYRILSTPGLVINEKVVCAGRIPSVAEVTTWLADAATQES